MENPLISIVVPVYKVEKYLGHCVSSILNQTYRNFELILVDDGSPDKCPQLCNQYAASFSYVKVIHKPNGGLSDARNVGMEAANGDLITFIDSDDYIHPYFLELLVKGIEETGSEISLIGIKQVHDMESIPEISKDTVSIEKYSAEEALCQVLYQKFHDVSASGILLPLALARKFKFPVGKKFEDLFTTYQYFFEINNVAFVHAPAYYYLQRAGSIRGGRDDQTQIDLIETSNHLVDECSVREEIKRAAKNKRFSNFRFLLSLDLSDFKERKPNVYAQLIQTIQRDKWGILLDKKSRVENKIAAIALLFGINGLKALYKIKQMKMN